MCVCGRVCVSNADFHFNFILKIPLEEQEMYSFDWLTHNVFKNCTPLLLPLLFLCIIFTISQSAPRAGLTPWSSCCQASPSCAPDNQGGVITTTMATAVDRIDAAIEAALNHRA